MKHNLSHHFERSNMTLLTDLYQLTMMQGYFSSGKYLDRAIFNVFYRNNPENGGYAICAGLDTVIEYIENLHFGEKDIAYLRSMELFTEDFLQFLTTFHFTGDMEAIPEGTVVQPNEILLKVECNILEAQFIETAILNFINHQTLIATKAARICGAAKGDKVMEFGLRRAQGPDAGTIGARAAIIGGCAMTSNVLAGMTYGCAVAGTHAHSWVMGFESELEAFRTYAQIFPNNAVLLVDTYDTLRSGVPHAIQVFTEMREAGTLGSRYGIRLDSGDLAYLSKEAKKMLDAAGFHDAIICASNDLDEYLITSLKQQGATINSWGVGTKLITSYDQAALGGVYKLAAIEVNGEMIPKIKLSETAAKTTNPGNKTVFRLIQKETGMFLADLIALEGETFHPEDGITLFDPIDTYKKTTLQPNTYTVEKLLVPIFEQGTCVYQRPTLAEIQARCQEQLTHLWEEVKRLEHPAEYYVDLSEALFTLKAKMMQENAR